MLMTLMDRAFHHIINAKALTVCASAQPARAHFQVPRCAHFRSACMHFCRPIKSMSRLQCTFAPRSALLPIVFAHWKAVFPSSRMTRWPINTLRTFARTCSAPKQPLQGSHGCRPALSVHYLPRCSGLRDGEQSATRSQRSCLHGVLVGCTFGCTF